MPLRQLASFFLLFALTFPFSAAAQWPSSDPPLPFEHASVGIGPSYQEAAPGTELLFSASGRSTLGGSILISLSPGLELVGEPGCNNFCGGPFVGSNSGSTTIEASLSGESVRVVFTAAVSRSASPGDTLGVSVMLVGGPNAVEMDSASVLVTQPVPTQAPTSLGDNRRVYVQASPQYLRMVPGGEALFQIQPGLWGMWEGTAPDMQVGVNVPSQLRAISDPYCGRGDMIPTQDPCAVSVTEERDGSTTYVITPGLNAAFGSPNGIYLFLQAVEDVEPGTTIQVTVETKVADDTLPSQPATVTSTIQVVENDALLVSQDTEGSVGVVLEMRNGVTFSGSTCTVNSSDSQLGLYEYGLETKYATVSFETGQRGSATDGSGVQICLVPVQFSNVPSKDLYILATSYGDDPPCRACVYGLVTSTKDAEVVFVRQ